MTMDDLTTNRYVFAGVSALTVLTWYALPDAVHSRASRVVIKTGLLGVTAAGAAMIPRVFPDVGQLAAKPRVDLPKPVVVALGAVGLAVATVGTVWGEKFVYAFGERRRASGARCAHTPGAVVLAAATGGAVLVDWARLAKAAAIA